MILQVTSAGSLSKFYASENCVHSENKVTHASASNLTFVVFCYCIFFYLIATDCLFSVNKDYQN